MKYSEITYPKWFIDELVNEEDKEKARNGLLKSTYKFKFRFRNNHIEYEQKVLHHIISKIL